MKPIRIPAGLRPFIRIRGFHVSLWGDDRPFSPGRVVAAAALCVVLFVPADTLPRLGMWGLYAVCAAAVGTGLYSDLRRLRPRMRMQQAGVGSIFISVMLLLAALLAEVGVIAGGADVWIPAFGLACVFAALGVWCLVRWRRLRVEAEIRLWSLRQKRKKK